jgi:cell division protein ZapA
MRDIRAGGKIIGLERITIMAALNLSYSLQAAETQLEDTQKASQGDVDRLAERVGQALGQLRQLKLN